MPCGACSFAAIRICTDTINLNIFLPSLFVIIIKPKKMKSKLTPRKLSNGALFIFNNETKDLYLIPAADIKHWEGSTQDIAGLQELVKNGKANHFNKTMLHQISDALTKVALLE